MKLSKELLIYHISGSELETPIGQDPNYLVAAYLDPRIKTNYLGVLDTERAHQEILLQYLKTFCEDSSSSSSSSTLAK